MGNGASTENYSPGTVSVQGNNKYETSLFEAMRKVRGGFIWETIEPKWQNPLFTPDFPSLLEDLRRNSGEQFQINRIITQCIFQLWFHGFFIPGEKVATDLDDCCHYFIGGTIKEGTADKAKEGIQDKASEKGDEFFSAGVGGETKEMKRQMSEQVEQMVSGIAKTFEKTEQFLRAGPWQSIVRFFKILWSERSIVLTEGMFIGLFFRANQDTPYPYFLVWLFIFLVSLVGILFFTFLVGKRKKREKVWYFALLRLGIILDTTKPKWYEDKNIYFAAILLIGLTASSTRWGEPVALLAAIPTIYQLFQQYYSKVTDNKELTDMVVFLR